MIEVTGLTKRYRRNLAVDRIDFSIDAGRVCGFIGPNGAGKSTTIKMLCGLVRPTAGKASIAGHDCIADPLAARSRLGYVPEAVHIYPGMTGVDFVRYAASFYDVKQPATSEWIERVGLSDAASRPIATYSKGMRQKLALAAALAHDPEVLILDEPLSGLDPAGILRLRDILMELRGEKTIFFSSHNLLEVQTVCDQVVFVNGGRIIAQGDVPELLGGRAGVLQVELAERSEAVVDVLKNLSEVEELAGEGVNLRLLLRNGADPSGIAKAIVMTGGRLVEMKRALPTLEELFAEWVGDRRVG